ncbi:hypothetical protein ACTJJ0_20280 [Chitinophaga sp. 22321]|uniref:Uncharacterized protein n=1 Tax=Chitinophaga hostae TaxID=2831022 RepID=A0ABS5J3L8_9BACT|nr:hypothetical protein [Chitinophaga hostae]MBS0029821.1 hypothetical protein [Chitinophaga hostae]
MKCPPLSGTTGREDGIVNMDGELKSFPYNKKAQSESCRPFGKHATAIPTVQRGALFPSDGLSYTSTTTWW